MTPIILIGNNLGERHRYLNSAVNEAYRSKQDLNSLDNIAEQSAVDRIFKISLASKLRHADYIIQNLKDGDMLYVSKALKCNWLLEPEFQHILNPEYLEDCLYPSMTTTAVTKMKHWVFLNLKDTERCQLFFLYYCDINFKLAVKFLRNCSACFIKEQFSKHMHKISPHDFKILCEKDALVAKMFFDALVTDEELKNIYLSKEKQYFTTLKSLIKSHTTMVLDITEKYFNKRIMKPFSSKATKFIIKHYRTRFSQKPQLYTAFLLNLQTLASCLNTEDAINLIFILARDNYLIYQRWFNYQKVEPIIKRISHKDRSAIKNKVFVDKDVGTIIEKWPYEIPSSPVRGKKKIPLFKDYDHDYIPTPVRPACCAKRVACGAQTVTMLDKLFEEYRTASFSKVLFELRKRIKAESVIQNRQYMMLVLVSKSGGHEKNLASVMQLLSYYKNEPSNLRAAVARSLVQRAQVWRTADDTWNKFLEFSHGLGLDGKRPEPKCIEGIHAVVLRQLINGTCDSVTSSLYFDNYTTFDQYSFSNSEKKAISDVLPSMVFNKALELTGWHTESMIQKLLDILTAFRLPFEKYPGLISKIETLAATDTTLYSGILIRLYRSRIARRQLFKLNFAIIETEASYLNALRHDVDVISTEKLLKTILYNQPKLNTILALTKPKPLPVITRRDMRLPKPRPKTRNKFKPKAYQNFFRKISIYFNEKDGLATQFMNVLKSEDRKKVLAKPLSLLLGDELMLFIKNVDSSIVDNKDKIFAAAMRANAHLARPELNIDKFGWSAIGTKALANNVLVCRNTEVNNYVQKLIKNKQTIKLACLLAKRNGNYLDCFAVLSKMKPTAALKLGLKILIRQKDSVDINIWNIVKSLLENFYVKKIEGFEKYFKFPYVYLMSKQIQPVYSIILYKAYKKESFSKSLSYLYYIEKFSPKYLDEEFIDNLIAEFLNKDSLQDYDIVQFNCLCLKIIIKYLLLCETEEIQQKRCESIAVVFLDKMEICLQSDENKRNRQKYLLDFLTSFRFYKGFFNDKYVSCVPVMIRILTWMKKQFPIEKHFKEYVHMHFNTVYYAAIKESIDKLPNRSIDDCNLTEARSTIGYIFGKHIAREISILKTTYFDSIQYMCFDLILNVLRNFINFCDTFTVSLFHGILDQSDGNLIAAYAFKNRRVFLETKSREEILLKLKKCENIEIQMFLSEVI